MPTDSVLLEVSTRRLTDSLEEVCLKAWSSVTTEPKTKPILKVSFKIKPSPKTKLVHGKRKIQINKDSED